MVVQRSSVPGDSSHFSWPFKRKARAWTWLMESLPHNSFGHFLSEPLSYGRMMHSGDLCPVAVNSDSLLSPSSKARWRSSPSSSHVNGILALTGANRAPLLRATRDQSKGRLFVRREKGQVRIPHRQLLFQKYITTLARQKYNNTSWTFFTEALSDRRHRDPGTLVRFRLTDSS